MIGATQIFVLELTTEAGDREISSDSGRQGSPKSFLLQNHRSNVAREIHDGN